MIKEKKNYVVLQVNLSLKYLNLDTKFVNLKKGKQENMKNYYTQTYIFSCLAGSVILRYIFFVNNLNRYK